MLEEQDIHIHIYIYIYTHTYIYMYIRALGFTVSDISSSSLTSFYDPRLGGLG